jgi:flagellar basal-body rod modification protein FlgD
MQIQGTTPVASKSQTEIDSAKASLDYDAFLKLFLEQLKSQDPTNPVDQTQTLAQLANFSNVEQSIKLNGKLDLLLQQSSIGQSVELIGKTIESLSDGTRGVVKTVEWRDTGILATLESGETVNIRDGIRIS